LRALPGIVVAAFCDTDVNARTGRRPAPPCRAAQIDVYTSAHLCTVTDLRQRHRRTGTGSSPTGISLRDLDRKTTPTPMGGHRIFFPEASAASPSGTYRDIGATPAQ